ncbi:MAG: FesM, partial [Anaerolineae bacterium]|nr:FesM [Anaerolineae bacterium]
QSFLIDHGMTLLGAEPNWRLGAILPADALFLLEMGSVLIGFIASLAVLRRIADNTHEDGRMATRAMAPWLALLALIAVLAVALFTLPMEMRGMMAG